MKYARADVGDLTLGGLRARSPLPRAAAAPGAPRFPSTVPYAPLRLTATVWWRTLDPSVTPSASAISARDSPPAYGDLKAHCLRRRSYMKR
jgi:hypothetical protein